MKINFKPLFFVIAIVFFFTSCSRPLEDKQLKEGKDSLEIVLEGVVVPKREMDILSPISGEISEVKIQNGMNIKKNEEIINYNLFNIELDIKKIKFKIAQKKLTLREIKASQNNTVVHNYKEQLKNFTYLKSLGAASNLEIREAQNNYIQSMEKKNSLNSIVNTLESDIELLEYDLKTANDIYKKSIIKSKINGFVTELNVVKGQTVSTNEKLGKVIDINKVIVKAGLASGLLQYVKKGQIVEIKFLTTPRKVVKSKVTRVIPIVDKKFGRMIVEIELENKDKILQPDTKALITIEVSKEKKMQINKNFNTEHNKLSIKSDN